MALKQQKQILSSNISDESEEDYYENSDESGSDFEISLEKLNLGPRKKLLVVSLNGLLLYRVNRFNSRRIPKSRAPDTQYGNYLVFRRPHSDKFMRFCLERFEVGIWSSAMERNVDAILDCVMPESRRKLLFVWDQEECRDSGFKSLENKEKPLFFKEFEKLWGKINGQFSAKDKFSASNTLLIDDKPYKALLNPPNTGIFPEEYDPENANDDLLDPKGGLCKYLDGVAEAEDVQASVKDNPFGQPAVTASHGQWPFYRRVLARIAPIRGEKWRVKS